MRKWENKSLSVEQQWSTSECVHIISNQHQAVPYRYQHIITASTHTLNHNRRRNPLLSVSLLATHTHTPSCRWSLISIIHLNFVLPLASLPPFYAVRIFLEIQLRLLYLVWTIHCLYPFQRCGWKTSHTSHAYLSKLLNTCWASC